MTGARIIGNRRHGYAVTVDGLTVSGYATREAASTALVDLLARSGRVLCDRCLRLVPERVACWEMARPLCGECFTGGMA